MGASYNQWEFQIHINFYRKKTINLNISRFFKKKEHLYIYRNLTKIDRYLY